jgi:Superfamily II DNA/RNA helicases, SNF2 family
MKTSDALKVGQIVRCRDRSWVVLPSSNRELVFLRPLSGNEPEICAIAPSLGLETITPDSFPLPDPQSVQDQVAIRLLMYAIRLNLRNGASPLRCLGNLSVRPRPYQLVPMLMALRQEVVRLLIADDVGIGKTIEACLIARELLDRKEINRIAVLCPPHLCDQWQRELQEKFNIEAVVIRSGTASRLERSLPNQDQHIFSYYQHLVVSIDYAKAQSRCDSFVTFCPDLVIVDEVHTCAGNSQHQQQRNELLKRLASRDRQHLIFLSATPHSGKDENFLSILSLLRAEFGNYDLEQLTKPQRIELAKHFVQRRRADVKQWLGDETPFPQRESKEIPYRLSPPYRQLFDQVFEFARQLVQGVNDSMSYAQRRGCYWSALALIRCVMSSPAAAIATVKKLTEVSASPDNSLISLKFDGLDQGELILIGEAIKEPYFHLATGDKNCLRALMKCPDIETAKQKLKGHVICLEQLVVKLIEVKGFNAVKAKVAPMRDCDTALKVAFGSGLHSTQTNSLFALNGYIDEIKRDCPNLLI